MFNHRPSLQCHTSSSYFYPRALRVAMFADGADADEARAAGADLVGGEDLIEGIKNADCASTKHRRWPEDVAWHPHGGSLFAVYTADGGDPQISVLNLNKPKEKNCVTFLEDKPHAKGIINTISFMSWEDTFFVTGGSDHVVVQWSDKNGDDSWKPKVLHRSMHSSASMGVAGMRQKQMVVSVGADKRIIGFDLQTGRADYKHQIESKCMSVYQILMTSIFPWFKPGEKGDDLIRVLRELTTVQRKIAVQVELQGTTFTFVNDCGFTVWPGVNGWTDSNTGFELTKGTARSFQAPVGWSGRIWGRTGCNFNVSGYGSTHIFTCIDDNSSLSISDCFVKCWNDCTCVGFNSSNINGTGCVIWTGSNNFLVNPHDNSTLKYVINQNPINPSTEYERQKRDEYFLELTASESFKDIHQLENNGGKGNDLLLFRIASIMAATDDFSFENKLGQGGFGPVFKGRLSDGREIAIKRISRTSGQGLVEFKNELVLIAKLQHTNLVQTLFFRCLADENRKTELDWRK
ncbi:unnamed protein product [Lactuca virosa]|uniref:Protein kinase domain-containing protein n=1 Tax=Lactuca virosa TaxID=75947 RepID=A0AAU9P222_9ASTR|nr:unnamed protein product [Lactuca virosa]